MAAGQTRRLRAPSGADDKGVSMATGPRHFLSAPPVVTLGLLASLATVIWLLGLDASTGSAESEVFVRGVPWLVWRFVAAVSVAMFLVLLMRGLSTIGSVGEWGIHASGWRRYGYLTCAGVLVAAIVLLLEMFVERGGVDLPVQDLQYRVRPVLYAGLLASTPWLALVWLAQAECHDIGATGSLAAEKRPRKHGCGAVAASGSGEAPTRSDRTETTDQLLKLWGLMGSCVGSLAMGVVATIITSGAIRVAFVDAHPERADEFPSSYVLLYGAQFAVILGIITVPLVASWRRSAIRLVDAACALPADGDITDAWWSRRNRMEKLLHLDIPLLRNPFTVLSIFVPLVTAALAAFIPELSKV